MQNAGTVDYPKISLLTLNKMLFFYLCFANSLLFQMPMKKNKTPANNKPKQQIPSPHLVS